RSSLRDSLFRQIGRHIRFPHKIIFILLARGLAAARSSIEPDFPQLFKNKEFAYDFENCRGAIYRVLYCCRIGSAGNGADKRLYDFGADFVQKPEHFSDPRKGRKYEGKYSNAPGSNGAASFCGLRDVVGE